MAERKPLHWERVITLTGAAILVGTELVGMSWAAGWALGGMFDLQQWVSRGVEALGVLLGCVLVYYFVRAALRHEPMRG
ncbi:MAG TPA: hypothetical protein VND97_07975 [Beijerinckiaceae bacterium]|nr:hypothetical protein [Beijerinckiaceae bacterium]